MAGLKAIFLGSRALAFALLIACVRLGASDGLDKDTASFKGQERMVYDGQPNLRIKGSGFLEMSDEVDLLQLEFDPPVLRGETYSQVLVKGDDTISLELKRGKKWVDSAPAPLVLKDATFKGTSLLSAPVTVAQIISTPDVYPSFDIIYLTASPYFFINGTNFHMKNTVLYFSPPMEEGKDVSISVMSPTKIMVTNIQKIDGLSWADEPGPLKLVAINTGGGKRALRTDLKGVTIAEMQASKKGHSISVQAHENVAIYQSTKVLTVAGEGFKPKGTKFRFANALEVGTNFTVQTEESSAVFELMNGSRWKQNLAILPSALSLLAADAGDGYVPLGAGNFQDGRKVATVFEDPSVQENRVKISRTMTHELVLRGKGFTKDFAPVFTFEPHIDRQDYVVHVVNRTEVKVSLAGQERRWMKEGKTGNLSVRGLNTGAGMVEFAQGVVVAEVVDDDERHESGVYVLPNYATQLYQTSETVLQIEGMGFVMNKEAGLTFGDRGPKAESFTCTCVSGDRLDVQLVQGHSWGTEGGPLLLTAMSFGDDEVTFKSPGVKVATIIADPLVAESQAAAYTTYTKRIIITGSGFVSAYDPKIKPKVKLTPTRDDHYAVLDGDWTDKTITLSLASGRSGGPSGRWAALEGDKSAELKVVSVDTGAGPVSMPTGGVIVATVIGDDETFVCNDSCPSANDENCDEDQTGEGSTSSAALGQGSNAASTSSTSQAMSRGYAGAFFSSEGDDVRMRGPACQMGTDCTDCGLQIVEFGKCTNTCPYSKDGECDDRRARGVCPDGTDCQDCGPWGEGNFTQVDILSSEPTFDAYEESDNSFLINDPSDPLLAGQGNNAVGQYKRVFVVHEMHHQESESAEGVFLETLWAASVLVGFSVVLYVSYLVTRCVKGHRVAIPIPTNPEVEIR